MIRLFLQLRQPDKNSELNNLIDPISRDLLNPNSLAGIAFLGAIFFVATTVVVVLIRKGAHQIENHLTDVTALQFVSSFAQAGTYLIGFMLYAHLVPELHALGTALLTGVSVVSVVLGLAAQNTLGNLIAGFSLVLYRPISVGDTIQISSPKGLISARVEVVSLGYTVLLDDDKHEIIVPNSVMVGNTVIRLKRARD